MQGTARRSAVIAQVSSPYRLAEPGPPASIPMFNQHIPNSVPVITTTHAQSPASLLRRGPVLVNEAQKIVLRVRKAS
jgi:hypothetical protein